LAKVLVKSQLFETTRGATFVGFRVLPDRIRVRAENLQRARKRLKQKQEDYKNGKLSFSDLTQSLRSWIAHLEHGDTWRLRERVFMYLNFLRA
jgi:hypothetical protein